jgi:hypothetical protein
MKRNSGKTVIFIIVILIILLGLGSGAFYLLQQEKTKSLALQEELTVERTKNKATQAELEDSKSQIARLQTSLNEAQAKISTLSSDLESEKTARQGALTQISQLKTVLEQENSSKVDLEKKLADSDSVVASLQSQLQVMEAQLKDLESKKIALEKKMVGFEEKSQNVELGTIVVGSATQAPAAKGATATKLAGKILVVNKDYNFAVINLGSKDGVAVGNEFCVYRNNKNIGDLKIEKVHDTMSAAGFVSADLKDKATEGDVVQLKI